MNRRDILMLGGALPLAIAARRTPQAGTPASNAVLAAGIAQFEALSPPGASIAYIPALGAPAFATAGVEDLVRRTPVRARTVFQIASLTKPFTAMVMLMLAQEGRLSLEDKARHWLDWLPEVYAGVSIRQLLNHVSGIPRDLRRQNIDEFSIDEFRRRFVAAQPAAAVGERWEYANAGYTLVALIAERVSGKPLGHLFAERIFGPLGMRESRYRAPLVAGPGRASGYDWQDDGWQPAVPAYSGWGNSGIETTIEDLSVFAQALHHRRLLRRESYSQMLAPAILASGATVQFPFRNAPSSYGLGWFLTERCGDRIASHGGAVAGFSSMLSWLPERSVSVASLCNGKSGPDRIGIAEKIAGAAFERVLSCTQ